MDVSLLLLQSNSKLCFRPTGSILSDENQLALPMVGGISSKVGNSEREKSKDSIPKSV